MYSCCWSQFVVLVLRYCTYVYRWHRDPRVAFKRAASTFHAQEVRERSGQARRALGDGNCFREMGAPSVQMKRAERAERAVVGARKKLCGRLPSDRGFREVGELEEQVVGLVASLIRASRTGISSYRPIKSLPIEYNSSFSIRLDIRLEAIRAKV